MTALSRTAVFGVATVATAILGRAAFLHKSRDQRPFSAPDVVFAFGLTTVLTLIAHLMSASLPLATMLLIPLFWSGVRSPIPVAVLHAVYTTAAVLALIAWNGGAAFGAEYDAVGTSVRLHLFFTVGSLISLVVATAVHELLRSNSGLTTVAEMARRRADALHTVTETIPDALLTMDQHGHATALNVGGEKYVRTVNGVPTLIRLPGIRPAVGETRSPVARALSGETVIAQPFAGTGPDGRARMFELTATPMVSENPGDPARALLLIRDVTHTQEVLRELERLAESDPLTGLPNRRGLDKALDAHLSAHRDRGGVLVLDLDGFKAINDSLGHGFGDEVLVDVARILSDVVGGADVLTRLGGDEFAVLVPDADHARLETVANGVVDGIRRYAATLEGVGRALSVSVGGTTIAAAYRRGLNPLVVADRLMYDVKESGRNGARVTGDDDDHAGNRPTGVLPTDHDDDEERELIRDV